ncbi:MAG: ASCH domain-containing protein, partial [Lactobacillus crispatus]|nr:ASCH domain-containing protein [Lactobacillus crispatus]
FTDETEVVCETFEKII